MNHKIKALLLAGVLVLGIFAFERYKSDIIKTAPQAEKSVIDFAANELQKEIAAPPPLRVSPKASSTGASGRTSQSAALTKSGVIAITNKERAQNGRATLAENALLDKSALIKANDLFAKQYFEHISPTGVGPGNLADEVGYDYIMIGENLALGDFKNDADLITAWMNSPGHRANILNAKYTEIGAAVERGTYEGQTVWIGVQEFGRPMSLCPSPDKNLQDSINAQKSELDSLTSELNAMKADIDSTDQSSPEYNQKVDQYNALVAQYDSLASSTQEMIDEYNKEARAFNACATAE